MSKIIRKLKYTALLAAVVLALAVPAVSAQAAVAKKLTVTAGKKGQLELPKKFTLTQDRILEKAKARADYVRVNKFKYGDAQLNPAFDDSEKIVSCDRYVQWVFRDLGFKDLPKKSGLVVQHPDPELDMTTWLDAHGFTKIEERDEVQAGDIVFLGGMTRVHVYILADYLENDMWLRYDCGGQDLIEAVQPIPAYLDNPAKSLNFLCAYRMVAPPVTWTSSNTEIAKVDASGVVKGVSQGVCKVTAKSDIAKKSYTITVKPSNKKPGKPKITLSRKACKKTKRFKVTTNTVSGADGFEIRYSRKKSMKGSHTKKVKSERKMDSVVVKTKLSGTRYYVRVRAYKKVNGKTLYSSWSKKKSVKSR